MIDFVRKSSFFFLILIIKFIIHANVCSVWPRKMVRIDFSICAVVVNQQIATIILMMGYGTMIANNRRLWHFNERKHHVYHTQYTVSANLCTYARMCLCRCTFFGGGWYLYCVTVGVAYHIRANFIFSFVVERVHHYAKILTYQTSCMCVRMFRMCENEFKGVCVFVHVTKYCKCVCVVRLKHRNKRITNRFIDVKST